MNEYKDCHYCEYACCKDENSEVDCYVEDFGYFDHHVINSNEAKECCWFSQCDIFPKT